MAADHEIWTGLQGVGLWEGVLMTEAVFDALGRRREVSWVLVSAGIVVLPHLCREESPHMMTWEETLKAWPVLRHYSTAKEEWTRLRRDLEALGYRACWGHRVGGRSARSIWESGQLQDHVAGLHPPEPSAHWRGLLDTVGEEGEGGEISVEEHEAALRAEWGDRLKGVRGDTARCSYGATRHERWGGARVLYVTKGGEGERRGVAALGEWEGGQDRVGVAGEGRGLAGEGAVRLRGHKRGGEGGLLSKHPLSLLL